MTRRMQHASENFDSLGSCRLRCHERARAGVPQPARHAHHAFLGRRARRHPGPHPRPGDDQGAGQAGHHRERGRGRQHNGAAKAASAKPDGHTVLMNHISHATNPALYRNLRYNTEADFEPVGLVADLPSAFVARKDFPANSFAEFLAYVKANKDKLNYGHAGIGSASHLCGLLFFSTIQTQVTTVPYKGTGPAMNDLMGGQIDLMCDQIVNVVSPIKGGKIKSYAVTSPTRAEALPNLPTVAEAGLPGFEVNIWYAPCSRPKAHRSR